MITCKTKNCAKYVNPANGNLLGNYCEDCRIGIILSFEKDQHPRTFKNMLKNTTPDQKYIFENISRIYSKFLFFL